MSTNLRSNIRKLFRHLTARRRWQFVALFFLMLAGAIAEMATLGAMLPFLALLAEPGEVARSVPVIPFDLDLRTASILLAALVVLAAVARVTLHWSSLRYTYALGADIGSEVYRRTLYQPYSIHIARNTSEVIAGLSKVEAVIVGIINPIIQGLVSIIIVLALLGVIIMIDPLIACAAALGFSLLYAATSYVVNRRLAANSVLIARNETQRVKAVQEGLGGIRDILLDDTQQVYVSRFRKYDIAKRRGQAVNSFIGGSPRYVIEATGMLLIIALAWVLSQRGDGLQSAIPLLGTLALGAQRLLPQMQQLYYSWTGIKGTHAQLQDVLALLEQALPEENEGGVMDGRGGRDDGAAAPIIGLVDLSFRYGADAPEVLRNVNLEIPRGARIGFIGKTGSGKSTVIDLILGLLRPTGGLVEIDGRPLTEETRRAWQARVAHVPQAIYLADLSIAENIAFGKRPDDIDFERVRHVAEKAQIAGFIEGLPQRYQTLVGERGVRLSGGQRQRIGIARALYKQIDVLVLDEATSALDDATEKSVMQAIEALGREITVLMIAHRTSTLSGCDSIVELEGARVRRVCGYREIMAAEV